MTAPLTAAVPVKGSATHLTTHQLVSRGTPTNNLFTEIGVRPIVNARGTYTIISGSQSLPEVKQAMFEASQYYVPLDELTPEQRDLVAQYRDLMVKLDGGMARADALAAVGLQRSSSWIDKMRKRWAKHGESGLYDWRWMPGVGGPVKPPHRLELVVLVVLSVPLLGVAFGAVVGSAAAPSTEWLAV